MVWKCPGDVNPTRSLLTKILVFRLFSLPMLTHLDTRRDYGEDRWIGIGLLRNAVAVTIYLEWEDEETIRIISARKATHHESEEYHKRVAL